METSTNVYQYEPICALATAPGIGAISVIRVSGKGTFEIVNRIFKGKNLENVASHTAHFGTIRDGSQVIDEVLITAFKSPTSFTKEDCVEISCHGSDYIVRYILKLLLKNGCQMAKAGEFTQRAFLNGQFDLVQAEAVADLIAADSEAAHKIALGQMRGGFSKKLGVLREELIHFASMIELELDFGEEDVEFADRDDLRQLIFKLKQQLNPLIDSFEAGNAIKEGVPVAIIGPPNAGKSTLLNAFLNEEKAIVTEIAGTTRDIIEDVLFIEGRKFRFIDTAGIRETTDVVETIGIERSMQALERAHIAIMLFDNEADEMLLRETFVKVLEGKEVLWVRNKADLTPLPPLLKGDGEIPDSRNVNQRIELPSFKEGLGGGNRRTNPKSMYFKLPEQVLENARSLRKNATSSEEFLWQLLRNRQLNGLKFRRQHPVEEGFVLDFYCAEYKLGVELDGKIHEFQKEEDTNREEFFELQYGVKILRFTNDDVLNRTEVVLNKIVAFTENSQSFHYPEKAFNPKLQALKGEAELRKVNLHISAKSNIGIEELKNQIIEKASKLKASDTTLTNLRHYESLVKTQEALDEVLIGLDNGITGDFLAQDIRLALYHLGSITGAISNDDLLKNIFGKFCIGK